MDLKEYGLTKIAANKRQWEIEKMQGNTRLGMENKQEECFHVLRLGPIGGLNYGLQKLNRK